MVDAVDIIGCCRDILAIDVIDIVPFIVAFAFTIRNNAIIVSENYAYGTTSSYR
jgi:hypothetical protein